MRSPSLRWQVAALVAGSVAAAQAIAFGVLLLWPPPEPPRMGVGQVLAAFNASEAELRATGLERTVVDRPPSATEAGRGYTRLIESSLAEGLGRPPDGVRVVMLDGFTPEGARLPTRGDATVVVRQRLRGAAGEGAGAALARIMTPGGLLNALPPFLPPFRAAVRQTDGRWMVVGPRQPLISPWQARVLLAFGAGALLLAPIAWWSARRLTRPVRLFAEAADRLGLDPGAPPLPVRGPAEVRLAAASFNRMQDRLRTYVQGRTAMVAAIAHDLRTPLTSLRIRAETAPERERMAADIARMEAMIAQVLAFVRGETLREPRELVDLAAIAQACVREAADAGLEAGRGAVRWSGEAAVWVRGEPLNLSRAVHNLIENAVSYGGGATVRTVREGGDAVLLVEDEGPGLPEAELERIFEPFARGEPSRSLATGGMGLGLASARGIARAHGGEVRLRNREGGGLEARLSCPLHSPASRTPDGLGQGVQTVTKSDKSGRGRSTGVAAGEPM